MIFLKITWLKKIQEKVESDVNHNIYDILYIVSSRVILSDDIYRTSACWKQL